MKEAPMRSAALALVSLTALSGVAFAQTASPTSPTPAPAPMGTPAHPGTPAKPAEQTKPVTPLPSGSFVSLQESDMLSSNLVGTDVYNTNNEDIGKIQDVAFDDSKQVKAIIVSVGGFLGMGKRYVAVAPDALKVKYDPKDKKWHANMDASKDQLKAAPEFKYEGRWNASKS
jgi:sporulation protein YlmC with PRC-barrel domain